MLAAAALLKMACASAMHVVGGRLWLMATIAIVFVPLERLIPYRPQRLFRRHLWMDFLHFFLGGIFIIAFVVVSYKLLGMASGGRILAWNLRHWPWSAQLVLFEIGWTFLGYWLHRLEHVWMPLWRLHSVHESSEELDWLSAFRLHPLEPALFHALTIIPLYFVGVGATTAIGYRLYSYVMTHIQHSNVNLRLGPLEYIIPSPQFHRWHHAMVEDEAGSKTRTFHNFSEYPIWDILFGTFYLPPEKPVAYGNARGVPKTYLGQLTYPFGWHHRALTLQDWLGAKLLLWRPLATLKFALTTRLDRTDAALTRLRLGGRHGELGPAE